MASSVIGFGYAVTIFEFSFSSGTEVKEFAIMGVGFANLVEEKSPPTVLPQERLGRINGLDVESINLSVLSNRPMVSLVYSRSRGSLTDQSISKQ